MKNIYALVGLFALVAIPLRLAYVVQDDLAHPERWDADWNQDPRAYLPVFALVPTCFFAWLASFRWRVARKRKLMAATLEEMWVKRNAGDHAGADVLLRRYKEISARQV